MSVQYISDDNGITTGVYIPIQEWTSLKENYHITDEDFELSLDDKKEIDKRIDQYLKNPNDVLDWEDVEKRLIARNS